MRLTKPMLCLAFLCSIFVFYSCGELANDATSTSADEAFSGHMATGDDQNLSEEQRQLYRRDAEILALRYSNEKDSTQTEVASSLIHIFYNGLVHIVNANHPKAQQVTQDYLIHAQGPRSAREILVFADSSASWVDAWRNQTTETGNAKVDELIDRFDFTLDKFSELAHTLPTIMATLRSSRAINVYAVSRLFSDLDEIENAYPDYSTDGPDISVLFFDNFLRYTFEYAYGDCPSGCINQHSWNFNVYFDGSIEFVDEGGDALPDA